MGHYTNTLIAFIAMALIWTAIGLPFALRLAGSAQNWLLAPAIGWAIANALAFPILVIAGTSGLTVFVVMCAFVITAMVFVPRDHLKQLRVPLPTIIGVSVCLLVSLCLVAGILPKTTSGGFSLSSPIFDHAKIALIDEIIRSGVPAQNPFFHEDGGQQRIAYYYLWHFSAAVVAILTNTSGWEADAALTGFTAFASLLAMIELAQRWGGGTWSALIVGVFSIATSLRATLNWMWPDRIASWLADGTGFGGWLFQSCWAPQHTASATCALLATRVFPAVLSRSGSLPAVAAGVFAAAAYQSSIWIGAIVLPLTLGLCFVLHLARSPVSQWRETFFRMAIFLAVAAILSAPFLYDQAISAALRQGGFPVVFEPTSVFNTDILLTGWGRVINLAAFWALYLPIELPAIYAAGLIGLWSLWRTQANSKPGLRAEIEVFTVLGLTSLFVSWLLASVIGENNDLGWRSALPAIMVLTAATCRLLCSHKSKRLFAVTAVAVAGLVGSLPETKGILRQNLFGDHASSAAEFAQSSELWAAVRRHTSVTERLANNPLFLADMTPWPVNISWALIANRRSCFAGPELALPFAAIPASRRQEITELFGRVFNGEATPEEVGQLARTFSCDTIVLVPTDGAWRNDLFAHHPSFQLAEANNTWRIYRRITNP